MSEELLGGDDEDLDGKTRLLETGIIDSMSMIGLIAHIERTFDLRIPDGAIDRRRFVTLDDITEFVLSQQS